MTLNIIIFCWMTAIICFGIVGLILHLFYVSSQQKIARKQHEIEAVQREILLQSAKEFETWSQRWEKEWNKIHRDIRVARAEAALVRVHMGIPALEIERDEEETMSKEVAQ